MPYEYQECTIVDIQQVSDHARIFIIQFPDQHTFQFRPGQFVMLNLPLNSKYTNRAYSIASPPAANNRIELVISLKATGKGTHFLWEHVEIGSIILVSKKALGKFALPENLDRDLCFISTGTGIAPLRSMLLDLFATNKAHGRIQLIFGNRYEKDILYRNEFELLQKSHPEFNFIPVLSRRIRVGQERKDMFIRYMKSCIRTRSQLIFTYVDGGDDQRNKNAIAGYGL
ncbi:MAG: oxidoreductase [Bacteroidetes bacterium]|nr:oxidoreductase [Bacteroidota bacterium]